MDLLLAKSVVGRNEKNTINFSQDSRLPCDVSPNALRLQPETLANSREQDNATSDVKKDKKYLD